MVRVLALTKDRKYEEGLTLEDTKRNDLDWYWVDFNAPTEEEKGLLESFFHFHPLAIEDCLYALNSPKLDYFDQFSFFILNILRLDGLKILELNIFVGNGWIVTYHEDELEEIDENLDRFKSQDGKWEEGPTYALYRIFDKTVDHYFPLAQEIETRLDQIEEKLSRHTIVNIMDDVFKIREDLLKLRKVIHSMRDLVYRIVNSERLGGFQEHKIYFTDIHDHLLKLSDMADSCREMTSDLRDSYMSVNSARLNKNMMILTAITSIFIPLTFIAGVYGMNFEHMPELEWKYGYFLVLSIMGGLGVVMFTWFKKRGWFDN